MQPLVLALLTSAWGYSLPSPVRGQLLYGDGLSPQDAAVVEAALRDGRPRVWAIVDEVSGPRVYDEADSDTHDVLLRAWRGWDALDTREDCLAVVGLDDRRIEIRCGSRLDGELGLHTTRLSTLTEAWFVPAAKRDDPATGLVDTVTNLRHTVALLEQVPAEVDIPATPGSFAVTNVPSFVGVPPRLTPDQTDPAVVWAVRAPSARALADDAVRQWAQQVEDPGLLAVLAYVWTKDEVAAATSDPGVLNDATRRQLQHRFEDHGLQSAAAFLRDLVQARARALAELDQVWTAPEFSDDTRVYAPEGFDASSLDAWAAVQPLGVRVSVIPQVWPDLSEDRLKILRGRAPGFVRELEDRTDDEVLVEVRRLSPRSPWTLEVAGPLPYRAQRSVESAWDASGGPAAVGAAELALALDETVGDAVREEYATRARHARDQALLHAGIGGVLGTGALGLVGLVVSGRIRRRRRLRALAAEDLREEVGRWTERLSLARDRLADFRLLTELRDRLDELKARGPATEILLLEVSRTLDELELGLRALEAQAARARAVLEDPPSGWSATPYEEARHLLVGATLETDAVSGDDPGLFGPAPQPVRFRPIDFAEELDGRFRAARAGWERLEHALDVAWERTAAMELDPMRLEGLRSVLEARDLPESWLVGHPLFPDPDAVLDTLDNGRTEDPVAYLDAIDTALDAEAAVVARIEAVVDDLETVAELREDVLALEVPDTQTTDPVLDPVAAHRDAHARWAELVDAARLPDEASLEEANAVVEIVDRIAVVALDAWEVLEERIAYAHRALAEADPALTSRETDGRVLREEIAAARGQVTELLAHHDEASLGEVWTLMGQVLGDLSELDEVVSRGRALLAEGDAIGALHHAELAEVEAAEAREGIGALTQATERLEADRAMAMSLRASLDKRRGLWVTSLEGLDADRVLREGDALRASLAGDWTTKGTWQERVEEVRRVHAAWKRSAAAAQRREREQRERERRRQDRREQQARRAARRRSTTSSSSWSRSSSSRSWSSSSRSSQKRSSFGSSRSSSRSSFGSSRRSGGSSYRSSRRSGGSSYRSSKRSGGSSW